MPRKAAARATHKYTWIFSIVSKTQTCKRRSSEVLVCSFGSAIDSRSVGTIAAISGFLITLPTCQFLRSHWKGVRIVSTKNWLAYVMMQKKWSSWFLAENAVQGQACTCCNAVWAAVCTLGCVSVRTCSHPLTRRKIRMGFWAMDGLRGHFSLLPPNQAKNTATIPHSALGQLLEDTEIVVLEHRMPWLPATVHCLA
jgi:hypothetical protein